MCILLDGAVQAPTIAGSDPMSVVALGLIIVAVIALFSFLPSKKYECKECSFSTYDRQHAAGHVHLHSLHKIDL